MLPPTPPHTAGLSYRKIRDVNSFSQAFWPIAARSRFVIIWSEIVELTKRHLLSPIFSKGWCMVRKWFTPTTDKLPLNNSVWGWSEEGRGRNDRWETYRLASQNVSGSFINWSICSYIYQSAFSAVEYINHYLVHIHPPSGVPIYSILD